MTITLNLPIDLEQRLRESTSSGDEDAMRQVLMEAVGSTVRAMLSKDPTALNPEEFQARLETLARNAPPAPALPAEAYSRASIYADHD